MIFVDKQGLQPLIPVSFTTLELQESRRWVCKTRLPHCSNLSSSFAFQADVKVLRNLCHYLSCVI